MVKAGVARAEMGQGLKLGDWPIWCLLFDRYSCTLEKNSALCKTLLDYGFRSVERTT